jgi:hypothetical protein
LGGIGKGQTKLGIEIGLDLDIFPQRASQQLVHRFQETVAFGRHRPQRLLAAEGQ